MTSQIIPGFQRSSFLVNRDLWIEFKFLVSQEGKNCNMKIIELVESYVKEQRKANGK